MARWRRFVAQLPSLLANKRVEDDLAREFESHLIQLADDSIAAASPSPRSVAQARGF